MAWSWPTPSRDELRQVNAEVPTTPLVWNPRVCVRLSCNSGYRVPGRLFTKSARGANQVLEGRQCAGRNGASAWLGGRREVDDRGAPRVRRDFWFVRGKRVRDYIS